MKRVLTMLAGTLLVVLMFAPAVFADDTVAMYRMYNPNSGEHFYTADAGERNTLIQAGWNYENVGWMAPVSGDPVYRLYNAVGGEHHYTLDSGEKDALVGVGWTDEGIGWRSDKGRSVPLHREYNPNAFSNNHNYTADLSEHSSLLEVGWRDEGVAWYALDTSIVDPYPLNSDKDVELVRLNGWWQSWGHGGTTWFHIVGRDVHFYNLSNSSGASYKNSSQITVTRFEVTDVGQGFGDHYHCGGYQVHNIYSSSTSYLHFDNDRDNLICSQLNGKGYSGTSSYTRVANPPQALVDCARAHE